MARMDLGSRKVHEIEGSESSEESGDINLFDDDRSTESSLISECYDDFAGDDDEEEEDDSSFISHAVPLSSGASICSVESGLSLSRAGSMTSIESALHSSFGDDTGDYYSSDEGEDYEVAVAMSPVKQASKRSVKKKRSFTLDDNSLDGGSCHSIKDILTIDSISEEKATNNAPAIFEYKFDEENGGQMARQMNNLLSKIVQSTQEMEIASKNAPAVHKSSKTQTHHKVEDPLLSKYLSNRSKNTKSMSKKLGAISSILGSSDSLQHMKGSKNKRVVKTREHIVRKPEATQKNLVLDSDCEEEEGDEDFDIPIKTDSPPQKKRSASRKSKKQAKDHLIQRYLDLRKTGPACATMPAGGALKNCDSLKYVGGKGSRVVKTRTRGTATAF